MGFVFLIMVIVGVFTPSNVYYLVISAVAAILFSSYLLYDLQVRQQPSIIPCTQYLSHGISMRLKLMRLPEELHNFFMPAGHHGRQDCGAVSR